MADSEESILSLKKPTTMEWVPLSLTFVEYPKDDLLGKFFALISLSPLAIIVGCITLILFRRDLHTIVFLMGVFSNELLNGVSKHLIAEPRPYPRANAYGEFGMPSSHAQCLWFFTTYVIYFIFIRLHHMNNNTTLESFWKALIVTGCVTLSTLVSIGRVYLWYHTVKQVLVGALMGFLFATLWFCFAHFILTPLFPTMASWKISELLLIRDTTLIPNVLWFEYTNSRQEARARSRKLVSMKSQ